MAESIFLKRVMEMAKIDQDLRFSAVRARKLSKGNNPVMENYLIYLADFVHGQRLKSLIRARGYPDSKSFGKAGMEAFWLLVQHQDYDVDLQKRCLKNCDFSKEQSEHLIDRIAVNEGRRQRYGTQTTPSAPQS